MPVSWKIDWVTFTKNKWEVETHPIDNRASALAWANIACQEIGLWLPELKATGGDRFYPWKWTCALSGARVSVPVDPGVQGIMIAFSGSSLGKREGTISLIATAIDHGWRTTRVDIAIDFIEENLSVSDIHQEFLLNAEKNSRTTQWIEGRGGNTFYIGSRQSNRFARVYDKGAEQKIAHLWTRVELEYKGGVAFSVGERLQNNSEEVLADISSFFRVTNPTLSARIDELANGATGSIKLSPRTASKRELWFHGQVTAATRAWASEDYDAARSWLSSMLYMLDNGI